jgi:hypothetical protein
LDFVLVSSFRGVAGTAAPLAILVEPSSPSLANRWHQRTELGSSAPRDRLIRLFNGPQQREAQRLAVEVLEKSGTGPARACALRRSP